MAAITWITDLKFSGLQSICNMCGYKKFFASKYRISKHLPFSRIHMDRACASPSTEQRTLNVHLISSLQCPCKVNPHFANEEANI